METAFDTISYIRVLGFRKKSEELLKQVAKNTNIPLITKMANIESSLSKEAFDILQKDIFAADLYNSVAAWKFQKLQLNEYNHPLIIL